MPPRFGLLTGSVVASTRSNGISHLPQAAPAVVNITVQTDGFPFYSAHSGSGFIVDPEGTILVRRPATLPCGF